MPQAPEAHTCVRACDLELGHGAAVSFRPRFLTLEESNAMFKQLMKVCLLFSCLLASSSAHICIVGAHFTDFSCLLFTCLLASSSAHLRIVGALHFSHLQLPGFLCLIPGDSVAAGREQRSPAPEELGHKTQSSFKASHHAVHGKVLYPPFMSTSF